MAGLHGDHGNIEYLRFPGGLLGTWTLVPDEMIGRFSIVNEHSPDEETRNGCRVASTWNLAEQRPLASAPLVDPVGAGAILYRKNGARIRYRRDCGV